MLGEIEKQQGLYATWRPLRAGVFEESSLGHRVFPTLLEGRRRPNTTLNAPLASLFQKGGSRITYLHTQGVHTVGDLLQSSQALLRGFDRDAQKEVPVTVQQYLEGLAITPHGRLIANIFAVPIEDPIDSAREASLVEAVDKALRDQEVIDARRLSILDKRYGLTQGYTHTQQEIADEMGGIGHTRVGQLEQRSLRDLQKNSVIAPLKQYLTVPKRSVGREVLGAIQYKDLPTAGDVWDKLPIAAQSLLTGFGVFDAETLLVSNLYELRDTRGRPIPEAVQKQIEQVLRGFIS
ncbi:MAG: hypothetical protein NUV52_02375 [Candidatus Roizmanbacteria bacterium]|nr:hypothetical protein [Candidatus Roizmanbacteria bacterium]